jgi:hypothetical protein
MAERDYHLRDEDFESFSMGTLSGDQLDRVEQHLLICQPCRQRVQESDAFVAAIKQAATRLRAPKPRFWGFRRLVPVLAAAGLAVFIFLLWTGSRRFVGLPAVATVALDTTRGADLMTRAPAERRLSLKPSLAGLPAFRIYRLEVVDEAGAYFWQGSYPGAVVGPLEPGLYFVRIYSPAGKLLREYGLQVERARR